MNKAAIYCRLSKEDKDKIKEGDDSESIQNQKMLLIDFAVKNGFMIYDVYSDDDYSGLDRDRPDFNRMIRDAKKGCFNTIICKSQSRFTRDMEYVEKYIHGLFPVIGVRFVGVVDNVDTNTRGNKKARQINGLINEWYCEDLSENIRSVFKAKKEQGQYVSPFPPYGYLKDPNDRHRLVIDPIASEVVRKIFRWYLEGYGVQKIRNKLSEEGIETPSTYKKKIYGSYHNPKGKNEFGKDCGFWAAATIKRILTNQVYIGSVVQGRERKISYKSSKVVAVPPEEWIIVPDMHEPIIDKSNFNLVQILLKERKYETRHKVKGEREIYLFSGKVFCKHCGSRMFRVVGRKGYSYLYCQIFSRSKGSSCRHNSIRDDELEKLITAKIQDLIYGCLKEPDTVKKICEAFRGEIEDTGQILRKKSREMDNVSKEAERIKKAVAALYTDKHTGNISEEEYALLKGTLLDELKAKEKRITALKKEVSDLQDNDSDAKLLSFVNKFADFKNLNFEILNYFVDHIEIASDERKNNEVAIYWNV